MQTVQIRFRWSDYKKRLFVLITLRKQPPTLYDLWDAITTFFLHPLSSREILLLFHKEQYFVSFPLPFFPTVRKPWAHLLPQPLKTREKHTHHWNLWGSELDCIKHTGGRNIGGKDEEGMKYNKEESLLDKEDVIWSISTFEQHVQAYWKEQLRRSN